MIRVLIVDDNADVREALKRIIQKTSDIDVGGEAADGQEALRMIDEQEWDVVLLDISLPDLSGLQVLKQTKRQRPNVRVLMVSVHPEEPYAASALEAGASGYLTKDKAAEQLAYAIRTVGTGSIYLSPRIAERLGVKTTGDVARSQTEGTLRKTNSDS